MSFNTKEIQIKYKWNTNKIVFLLNCVERLYKAHRTTNTHGCTCTLGWPRFYNFFMNHGKSNSAEVLWVMLPNTSMNKSYCSNFFLFWRNLKMKEVGPKNMHFFTLFEKLVKINVFQRFRALTSSFSYFMKKNGTVTCTFPTTFVSYFS